MLDTGRTTSQLSQRELALRFLLRTRCELELMRACLPDNNLPIEPPARQQLERMAAKMSSSAEAFGFPGICVSAGAIELLTQMDGARSTVRDRVKLTMRLGAQMTALEVILETELADVRTGTFQFK